MQIPYKWLLHFSSWRISNNKRTGLDVFRADIFVTNFWGLDVDVESTGMEDQL